ncbi:MAG TPA: biotin/lipoyl-binding protein [Gemmataceae bacterium]|nr:biotin/lipoyl-binding protein [Gemmataceae bacterium]
MAVAELGTDLIRRKQVKLVLRTDLEVKTQKYEGRTYQVIKDPISLRYYYFTEQDYFVLCRLDGKHTLEEIQKAFEIHFRPERLTLEDIEHFGQQLLTAGLAHQDTPQAGKQLYDRRKKRRRREIFAAWTNILYIKIPFCDPDRLLDHMLPYLRWIFTRWFLVLSACVMFAAVFLVGTHFETFRQKIPAFQEFFRFRAIVSMWALLGIVKIIHEFGHGLSCKAFGGEVHEMGMLFLCLSPCLYCNVSDAWILPSKWRRIIISFAGIYVELMIAAIATFVWWNSASEPWLHDVSMYLMVVCSISTVVFNGNPLMRYDGYYILADWLEIPNLRDKSNQYLKNVVLEHCLGVEVQPEPYMALGRRIMFVSYAIVSYIYRWVVTFSILYFIYIFLKPYKLGTISAMMALAALASLTGWPLYNLGRNIHRRGRLPDMSRIRVTLCVIVVGLLLFAFFFVPLPVSRIRDTAVVQVRSADIRAVSVPIKPLPPVLRKLYVHDGQYVRRGDVLAEFSSIDIETQLAELEAENRIANRQVENYRTMLQLVKDSSQREKLHDELLQAVDKQSAVAYQAEMAREALTALVLRAPRDGVVMGAPTKDDIGKQWDREKNAPFCNIGNPKRLRALLPVSPADFRLLRDDLNAAHKQGRELWVDIRPIGLGKEVCQGQVGRLPAQEAKDVPPALAAQAGGPLAVKQGSRPNTFVPQSQQYLVPVLFLKPDPAICPGTLCQVKIHCEWRSAAWWVWRTVNKTFDLGLI